MKRSVPPDAPLSAAIAQAVELSSSKNAVELSSSKNAVELSSSKNAVELSLSKKAVELSSSKKAVAPPDLAHCMLVWFPAVNCARHGLQPTAYYVCAHVIEGFEPNFKIDATRGFTGVLLCAACSELKINSHGDISGFCNRLTHACPICLHRAGLLDSPEVQL